MLACVSLSLICSHALPNRDVTHYLTGRAFQLGTAIKVISRFVQYYELSGRLTKLRCEGFSHLQRFDQSYGPQPASSVRGQGPNR